MTRIKTYYKRNLPHYQPAGYVFLVNMRLDGSLPLKVIQRLQNDYRKEIEIASSFQNIKAKRASYSKAQLDYFKKFEEVLHNTTKSPCWLAENTIASVIYKSLHFGDTRKYNLYCFTIMPNHIHVILQPIVERFSESLSKKDHTLNKRNGVSLYILTSILQDFKKFTARECNLILNRTGKFWQHESYDHVVRDREELLRLTEYILNNPVKAGLIDNRENWKWNYYNPHLYV